MRNTVNVLRKVFQDAQSQQSKKYSLTCPGSIHTVQFYDASETTLIHIRAAAMAIVMKNKLKKGEVGKWDGSQRNVLPEPLPPSPIKRAFARSYETAGGHCWPVLYFMESSSCPARLGTGVIFCHMWKYLERSAGLRGHNSRWWLCCDKYSYSL